MSAHLISNANANYRKPNKGGPFFLVWKLSEVERVEVEWVEAEWVEVEWVEVERM